MTEIEKLRRDISTLKESIELNQLNLHQRTTKELREILENTEWCMKELDALRAKAAGLVATASN